MRPGQGNLEHGRSAPLIRPSATFSPRVTRGEKDLDGGSLKEDLAGQ